MRAGVAETVSPSPVRTAGTPAIARDLFAWSDLLAVRSHAQPKWRFTNHRRAVILFLIVLVLSETVLVLEIES